MTTAERQRVRDAWDHLATGYDELVTPLNTALAEDALRLADLRPGMRVLDVATGTGSISIPAARLGARVQAVDISPAMIEQLRTRARETGLHGLDVRVMDGQDLDLEDDTFDLTGSQFGIMLFPDLPRGLREAVRVTKPGGRVLMIAFGAPGRAEFLTFFLDAVRTAVPDFAGPPMDPPPLPFQVADPGKLRWEMEHAGLRHVDVETRTHPTEFRSGAHLWDTVIVSNPIGAGIAASLTAEQTDRARRALDTALRERSGGAPGGTLTSDVNIAVGTK